MNLYAKDMILYFTIPNIYNYICVKYFNMIKQKGEVSVFFSVPEDLLKEFNEAVKAKGLKLGISLNKKQAYNLALKEITELWKTKNPGQ